MWSKHRKRAGDDREREKNYDFFSVWPFEKMKNVPSKLTGWPAPGSEVVGSTELRKREYEKTGGKWGEEGRRSP